MIAFKPADDGTVVICDPEVKRLLGTGGKCVTVVGLKVHEARALPFLEPEEVARALRVVGETERSVVAVERVVVEAMVRVVRRCEGGREVVRRERYEVRRLPLRGRSYRRLAGVEEVERPASAACAQG